MTQIIPDSIDPVRGWRVWSLTVDPRPSIPESIRHSVQKARAPRFLSARQIQGQDGTSVKWKLYSPAFNPYRDPKRLGLWTAHEAKKARCFAERKQCRKPLKWSCSCGVYAFRTPEPITDQDWIPCMPAPPDPPSVVGQILGWGQVIEHEQGWRATFAYPSALALCCMYCLANHSLVRAEVVRFPTHWHDPFFGMSSGPLIVPLCRACTRPSPWWKGNVCLPAPAVEEALATHYGVTVLPALPKKQASYHGG